MVCAGHVLAAALVLIQLFDVHILAVSGGSVCVSDLYCNAMQLDMCVVVEASVELFVTQVGEKEVMHFRNS